MRRRTLLRVVVVGGLLAAIAVAVVLVVPYQSPLNRRMRQLGHLADHVPECSEAEISTVKPAPHDRPPPGLRMSRTITCGPPDNLGPFVGVDVFRTHAQVLTAMAVAGHDKFGSAQCASRTELLDLQFFHDDGSDPNAVKIARGYDRGFCRAAGAAAPQFTGFFTHDGET